MASPAGHLLTLEHYRQQVALRAQAVRDAARLWSHWTPGDTASWERMVALAIPLVNARHAQSAALAGQYFEQFSSLEIGKREAAILAQALPEEMIGRSLAVTGLGGTYAAKSRGLSLSAAAQVGFTKFQGGLSRLALEGGRTTIVDSVASSNRAKGWTRITSGEPCDFCAGLADEASTPDAFQAHDNCSCTAEPEF